MHPFAPETLPATATRVDALKFLTCMVAASTADSYPSPAAFSGAVTAAAVASRASLATGASVVAAAAVARAWKREASELSTDSLGGGRHRNRRRTRSRPRSQTRSRTRSPPRSRTRSPPRGRKRSRSRSSARRFSRERHGSRWRRRSPSPRARRACRSGSPRRVSRSPPPPPPGSEPPQPFRSSASEVGSIEPPPPPRRVQLLRWTPSPANEVEGDLFRVNLSHAGRPPGTRVDLSVGLIRPFEHRRLIVLQASVRLWLVQPPPAGLVPTHTGIVLGAPGLARLAEIGADLADAADARRELAVVLGSATAVSGKVYREVAEAVRKRGGSWGVLLKVLKLYPGERVAPDDTQTGTMCRKLCLTADEARVLTAFAPHALDAYQTAAEAGWEPSMMYTYTT